MKCINYNIISENTIYLKEYNYKEKVYYNLKYTNLTFINCLRWFRDDTAFPFNKVEREICANIKPMELYEYLTVGEFIALFEVQKNYLDYFCRNNITYFLDGWKNNPRIEELNKIIERYANELIIKDIIE